MRTLSSLLLLLSLSTPVAADFLAGQVVDSQGVGVGGVNIDVENMITGDKPDILNGGTNPGGFFNATLPPGLYEVTFNPPP